MPRHIPFCAGKKHNFGKPNGNNGCYCWCHKTRKKTKTKVKKNG